MHQPETPPASPPERPEARSPAVIFETCKGMDAAEIAGTLDRLDSAEKDQLYLHTLALPETDQRLFAAQYIRNYLREKVSAQTMLDALFQSEIAPEDTVQHRLLGELAHNFSYRFTFDNNATEKAVKELVDEGDFFRLGMLLDTLLNAYRASHSAPNPTARTGNMHWLVDDILSEPKLSPLLKFRAEALLIAMKKESDNGPTEIHADIAPFRLSGNHYGWVNSHRVFLIDRQSREKAVKLSEQAQEIEAGRIPTDTPQKFEFGNIDMGGEFIPIPTKRTAQSRLYRATKELSMQPISKELVSVVAQKDSLRDQDMYDFAYILSKPMRERLEVELRVSLADLSLPAQYQFLQFIKQHPDASGVSFEQIKALAHNYGTEGVQSFLALAHGDEQTGKHILTISEKLPKPAVEKIFSTYAAIVEAVDGVTEILQDQPDSTLERIKDVKLHLYTQGVRLLREYGAAAKECVDETCQDIGRELAQRLALAKSSVFAMGAVTRQLVKEESFDFEKFSQLELVQETPPLSDNFAEQIRTMHQSNTEQYPEKLKEYWRGTLAEALASENPEQKFVYVKMGEDVLAVMRVIDDGGAWYGASFNVNPTIQGSRVGSELLKKVIADMGSQKPFVADVYAENPMLQNYLDTFGFEITKTTEDYHGTGATVHEITWTEPE